MDRTSGQSQVNLSLLRSISLKTRPLESTGVQFRGKNAYQVR
jgi:hypothetical protein